jgi:hypothetical protein
MPLLPGHASGRQLPEADAAWAVLSLCSATTGSTNLNALSLYL